MQVVFPGNEPKSRAVGFTQPQIEDNEVRESDILTTLRFPVYIKSVITDKTLFCYYT